MDSRASTPPLPLPPIQVFCVNESAVFPTKGHESDAGWDISIVRRDYDHSHASHARFFTRLVFVFNDPELYGELYARSSAAKLGVCLSNGVGIIDPSYRGELIVSLSSISTPFAHYLDGHTFPIRIAQLVIKRRQYTGTLVREASLWHQVEKQYQTVRGSGGFGSTGK